MENICEVMISKGQAKYIMDGTKNYFFFLCLASPICISNCAVYNSIY